MLSDKIVTIRVCWILERNSSCTTECAPMILFSPVHRLLRPDKNFISFSKLVLIGWKYPKNKKTVIRKTTSPVRTIPISWASLKYGMRASSLSGVIMFGGSSMLWSSVYKHNTAWLYTRDITAWTTTQLVRKHSKLNTTISRYFCPNNTGQVHFYRLT